MSNFDISISVSWQGRLRRRTFWCTFLMFVVIGLVGDSMLEDAEGAAAVLSLLLLPFELSLIVRRSQDAGLRDEIKCLLVGAHILLAILGIVLDEDAYTDSSVGTLVMLVSLGYVGGLIAFLSKDSVPGTNKWGPNPKEGQVPRWCKPVPGGRLNRYVPHAPARARMLWGMCVLAAEGGVSYHELPQREILFLHTIQP